jgi:UDP-glucose 4-epimerase
VSGICLVTGATGAVGPAVVAALGEHYQVRTLSRRPVDAALFSVPVESHLGDITDTEAVRRAAAGAHVIVHLACLLHVTNPPPALHAEYERVNVGGTASVLDAARAEGVGRIVVMSSIAAYGYAGARQLDEHSPTAPDTPYGRTKLAAERLALAATTDQHRPLCTVLRSAAVYGDRVKGNYARLVRALARKRFVPIGPGDNRRALIHDSDLARAVVLAARHPAAPGRVYNVSDGEPHTLRDIVAAICAALGRRPPRVHVPLTPVAMALRLLGAVDRGGRLPVTAAMLDKYLEDCTVSADRIRDELGFRPVVALRDGWARAVEGMRTRGDLQ